MTNPSQYSCAYKRQKEKKKHVVVGRTNRCEANRGGESSFQEAVGGRKLCSLPLTTQKPQSPGATLLEPPPAVAL